MPYLARTNGNDNIPEPIAVPAKRAIALNCFFIKHPTKTDENHPAPFFMGQNSTNMMPELYKIRIIIAIHA